jgi:hypothetical protein
MTLKDFDALCDLMKMYAMAAVDGERWDGEEPTSMEIRFAEDEAKDQLVKPEW